MIMSLWGLLFKAICQFLNYWRIFKNFEIGTCMCVLLCTINFIACRGIASQWRNGKRIGLACERSRVQYPSMSPTSFDRFVSYGKVGSIS